MVLAHSTTHTSIIVTIRSMRIQVRTSYTVTDLQARVLCGIWRYHNDHYS